MSKRPRDQTLKEEKKEPKTGDSSSSSSSAAAGAPAPGDSKTDGSSPATPPPREENGESKPKLRKIQYSAPAVESSPKKTASPKKKTGMVASQDDLRPITLPAAIKSALDRNYSHRTVLMKCEIEGMPKDVTGYCCVQDNCNEIIKDSGDECWGRHPTEGKANKCWRIVNAPIRHVVVDKDGKATEYHYTMNISHEEALHIWKDEMDLAKFLACKTNDERSEFLSNVWEKPFMTKIWIKVLPDGGYTLTANNNLRALALAKTEGSSAA